MNPSDPKTAVRPIRKRLFFILLLALLAVVVLVIATMLGSAFLLINRFSNPQPPPRSGIASVLEAYYEGAGSWEGVQVLLDAEPPGQPGLGRPEWEDCLLLDAAGVILLDHGSAQTGRAGEVYRLSPGDIPAPLFTGGNQQIGTLVSTRPPTPPGFIQLMLAPLGLVSVSLAVLTLAIGFLLSKRFVNPLADVIAAARSVAGGNLSTRVEAGGPDDLRVLSDSFNQMAATLEENDRRQRELMTDIAHELRTPLSIIQGKLEGMVEGIYPVSRRQLAVVVDEAGRLEKIIEDVDMQAQAAARQLHFESHPFQLEKVAKSIAASFAAEAADKGISLGLEADPGLPAVIGDPQRTAQVIGNLLGNALRYIPSGSYVSIRAAACAQGVSLMVSDDGSGVAESDLPFIFDRLWRGEKSRSRAGGGAGLGLAIARQFIETQGGRMWAANREGGGLQIGFWLPDE
jgi:signal transduction histidine kinase